MPDLLSKLNEEITSRSTPGGRGSPWPPASQAELASFERQLREAPEKRGTVMSALLNIFKND